MSSNRFRRIKRLGAALTAGALGVGFLPIAALTGTASASAPTPTVQSTTAWCANASTTNPFTDLPSSNVHFANVLCLAAAGITHGTTATTYSPSNPVRRDQMASFIAQFLDLAKSLETTAGSLTALPASGPDAFTDDNGDTHEANINRLAAAGIVNGTGGGTYSPADPVRRDQMASFINNAIEFLTGTRYSSTTDFFDDDNGDVHEANINGLAGAGIVSGTGGGLYSPANPVLRDSMGSFIIRTAAKLNADGKIKILPPAPGASNQSYAVNPGFGGVKTVSTTTGANTQRGAITCSVTTTDTVSLGLVPFLNTTVVSGKTVFKDANQDLRADNMGNPSGSGLPGAFIQSVNGVAQPANTAFIPNVVAGSDGKITFILNSVTNNSTASAVVFKDADTNGQLNLTSTDPNTFFGLPSEAFGSGCSGVWIPPEAGLATFNLDLTDPSCPINPGAGTAPGVVIAIQLLHQFTSCSLTFNYGSDDVYQYASNVGGPNITITEADFDKYLSGASQNNKTSVGPLGTTRLGDFLTVNYNPTGVSTFTITRDVPAAPTGLTATVGDADAGGVQNDVMLAWVAPPNPDQNGFMIFRAPINGTTGVIGAYAQIGTAVKGATAFNDLNAAPGKYSYIVLAINKQGAGALPGPDASPDSVAAQATVTATVATLPPVSVNSSFVNGPTQTNGGTPASGGDTNILDKNDVVTWTFANAAGPPFNTAPISVTPSASVTVHDRDGTVVTLTNGVNAAFAVGGANNSVLTVAVTTTPTATQTNGGNAQMDTDVCAPFGCGSFWAVDAATGITNSAGSWNLPQSGQPGDPNLGDVERDVFTNSFGGPWTSTGSNNNVLPLAVPSGTGVGGLVSANSDTNKVTISAGSSTGSQTIDNSENFAVFNATGTQIATGVYNDATGTTVTPSPALVPNSTIYVVYVDSVGTNGPCCSPAGRSMPSQSSNVLVATATPSVISVSGTGGTNQITVNWTTTVQQNGAASGYQVFDSSNATLVATGTAAVANGTSTTVTLNTTLTAGTTYTLRVAPGTVQNPVGNVPNAANTKAFTEVTTSATQSTLVANPTSVAANGTTTSTVTVTLKNAAGAPVVGHQVSLTQTGSGSTITGGTPTTNGAGQASWTVKSSTVGSATYTAHDNTDNVNVNQTATVTYTAVPTITSLSPNHGAVAGGNLVNINGTGFQSGATVTWGTTTATVNSITPTVISVTAPSAAAAGTVAGGTAAVAVHNTDGGVSSSATYSYDAGALAINSVTTDPANNRLVVTFNQSTGLVCPNTAGGKAAWVFTNQDNPNSGGNDQDGGQATGSPASVSGPSGAQCFLNYATVGTNDYGTLAYNQPVSGSDQVSSTNGGALPPSNPTVTDSTTPSYNSVAVVHFNVGTGQPTLTFSEPVKCSTVSAADFTATLNGGSDIVTGATCTGLDNATVTLTLATPSNNVNDNVTVTLVGTITDEAGLVVPAASHQTFST